MNNQNPLNITLDFTQANKTINDLTAGQAVAVMPAELAKRALKAYAKQLERATPHHIINQFAEQIRNCGNVQQSVECAIEYIQERELISNLANEKWDAYEVKQEAQKATVSNMQA